VGGRITLKLISKNQSVRISIEFSVLRQSQGNYYDLNHEPSWYYEENGIFLLSIVVSSLLATCWCGGEKVRGGE